MTSSKGSADRGGAGSASGAAIPQASHSARTTRETVESIVIAFILAFLFRTFEAEAFVIPTGSMAPTLQGRHKDVECPQCGYEYRVGASSEMPQAGPPSTVKEIFCPMCSFPLRVDPSVPEGSNYPSYNGDRILVSKFSYDLRDPQRWDVVVFKFPEQAKDNYIKRLIGLPGEMLRISGGDIFTRPLESGDDADFQIQRKPPEKMLAMLQLVYDNDYVTDELIAAGFPPRWQNQGLNEAWETSDGHRTFSVSLPEGQESWLRYQHVRPEPEDWRALAQGQPIGPIALQPILDYYTYNDAVESRQSGREPDGNYWVGDLAVEADVEVLEAGGELILELVENDPYQVRINLETGIATLLSPALPDFQPRGATPVQGPGKYRLRFTNVDDQLLLFVNDEPIDFEEPTTYTPERTFTGTAPEAADDRPVGIAAVGATLKVSDLRVLRDIYYIADARRQGAGNKVEDHDYRDFALQQFPEDPEKDQFFVLGDNSPASMDSRLWPQGNHYVERQLMIGKALYIYWPHTFNYFTAFGKQIPFPFFPNFSRMGFVR